MIGNKEKREDEEPGTELRNFERLNRVLENFLEEKEWKIRQNNIIMRSSPDEL
jgi:hypothetical protein